MGEVSYGGLPQLTASGPDVTPNRGSLRSLGNGDRQQHIIGRCTEIATAALAGVTQRG